MPEGSKKSRLTAFKDNGDDESSYLQFPELDGAEYMIALLTEAGLAIGNGMGPAPLSWQEIQAWLNTTELQLAVGEKLTLKEMSEVYVSELIKSAARTCAAPYTPPVEPEEIDRKAVSDKVREVLRGFKRKK